jgi:hypothetical protein
VRPWHQRRCEHLGKGMAHKARWSWKKHTGEPTSRAQAAGKRDGDFASAVGRHKRQPDALSGTSILRLILEDAGIR